MRDLRRRAHSREPLQTFYIYCEGKNTEPSYFSAFGRYQKAALFYIKTVGAVGVPKTVAEAAVKQAQTLGLTKGSRKKLNSYEEKDQVWAVFDRDEHDTYYEAINLCERHNVGIARSNPCFEVWLILHEVEYHKPDGRHAVQAKLQELRPEYDLRGSKNVNCDEIIAKVEAAEIRADKQLRARQSECAAGSPLGPPYTTVGNLTRAIRTAANSAKPHPGPVSSMVE